MNEKKQRDYDYHLYEGQYNAAQQMGKTCFSTYLFQLAGSKFLLRKLIQLPILAQCSAEPPASDEQPASLMKCMHDLQKHKKTPEYKEAFERAQKRAHRGGGR